MSNIRVGNGFDVHSFIDNGRNVILGGVSIPFKWGLAGHSDADVLLHAIIDSIVSPAGLGDIGRLFPDTDPQYKNISSLLLLEQVADLLIEKKITIINTDSIIICEEPKVAPYIQEMRAHISTIFNIEQDAVSIKGKTTEKLGFTGRKEGIAVYTVTLLQLP